MDVKCLLIISLALVILAIGAVGASPDADALANESMAIENDEEIPENIMDADFYNEGCIDSKNDSILAETPVPNNETGDDDFNDSRHGVDYQFFLDVTDDYVLGTENILMVSVPALSNKCLITLDKSDNVLYNFRPSGVGWMMNIGNWNLTPGKHMLNLSYPGDDDYKPFSSTINFTCSFIKASIGDEMVYPRFDLTFANDASGKVQIFVDDEWYMNKTVEEFRNDSYNGFPRYEPIYTYFVYLNGLKYGRHTYKIIYSDDEKYVLDNPIEGKFNVTYLFDAVEIDTNGIHNVGDEVKFAISAGDDVKKVIVDCNGKSMEVIPTSDDYYSAVVVISDLKAGVNNVTFTSQSDACPSKTIVISVYMNPVEEPQGDFSNVTAERFDSKIIADNLKVMYCDGSVYKVRVFGDDGKPAKTKVTFLINGKAFKTVNTNANGVASVKITKKPGNYKITAKSLGKSVTRKLTVGHILKLKAKSGKKITVKARLAKVNGKYLKGKKITLKFAGKKLTAKTDKKGVAKFTIKKFKSGKIKFQATYLKDSVKCTVKV